ncbi:MAG: hypothetical protein RR060_06145, partial [Victivallaceae bacterium]
MSGIKAAEVRQNLQRTIKVMLQQMADAQKNDALMQQLLHDESLQSAVAAEDFIARLHQRGVSGVNSASAAQLEKFFAQGKREQELAQRLQSEAEKLRRQSGEMAVTAEEKVRFVGERLETFTQFMDKEDNAATEARQLAKSAGKLEAQAATFVTRIIEARKRAKDAFDTVTALGETYKFDDVRLDIKNDLNSTANSAAATKNSAAVEIEALMRQIAALSPEKFLPGEFQIFQTEFTTYQTALRLGSPAATERSKIILEGLKNFHVRLMTAQTEAACAKISATNSMMAAEQELKWLNLAEIKEYITEPAAVMTAAAELEKICCAVKSGQYKYMSERIEAALKVIRDAKKTSVAKKLEVEERNYVADAIMNALYEQGYDAPTFYYARQRSDGSDDLLSFLKIFPKSPGELGFLRMNFNLRGQVTLSVDNIP